MAYELAATYNLPSDILDIKAIPQANFTSPSRNSEAQITKAASTKQAPLSKPAT